MYKELKYCLVALVFSLLLMGISYTLTSQIIFIIGSFIFLFSLVGILAYACAYIFGYIIGLIIGFSIAAAIVAVFANAFSKAFSKELTNHSQG